MPLLKLLPREVSDDLKWLVWNDIWTAVNTRLASCSDQSEPLRQKRRKQGEEDARRASEHYEKCRRKAVLEETTITRFREQINVVATAGATGALEGKWLGATQAQVLQPPEERSKEN